MKNLIEKIKIQAKLLTEKIEKREFIFEQRSDRWKESEKGAFYEEATEELEDMKDELEDLIERLKEWEELN